jgi:hypothetical protein
MKTLILAIVFLTPAICWAQTNSFALPPVSMEHREESTETLAEPQVDTGIERQRSSFHRAINRAANDARKAGQITRADQVRIRIAMMSPAFRKHAAQLAVIQMAFSGSDVPTDESGNIDEAAIDWATVIPYLIKFLELLLELLQDFNSIQG